MPSNRFCGLKRALVDRESAMDGKAFNRKERKRRKGYPQIRLSAVYCLLFAFFKVSCATQSTGVCINLIFELSGSRSAV